MEINGIKYVLRTARKPRVSRMMRTLLMISNILPKEININIVEEFKLIQGKKSKLSRSDRDLVEKRFYNLYIREEL